MKKFFTILLFWAQASFGQTCISFGFGSSTCAPITNGVCETWSHSACPGVPWTRSHGSPQLIPVDDPKHLLYYQGYMWGRQDVDPEHGEGMFTAVSFVSGQSYTISIDLTIDPTNSGRLRIFAANGLSESTFTQCGDNIPIVSKQNIGDVQGPASGWLTKTFTFTASANFSQLWVYAVSDDPTGSTQFNAQFAYISICDQCATAVVINHGLVSSGTSHASSFTLGSSAGTGGSGTVGVSSVTATTLIAANYISLLPAFSASVTTGGDFRAYIGSCTASPMGVMSAMDRPASVDLQKIPLHISNESGRESSSASLVLAPNGQAPNLRDPVSVFPTVGSGIINITGNSQELGRCFVTVYSLDGRIQYQSKFSGGTPIKIDLGSLSGGMYLVRIEGATSVVTKKIQIAK